MHTPSFDVEILVEKVRIILGIYGNFVPKNCRENLIRNQMFLPSTVAKVFILLFSGHFCIPGLPEVGNIWNCVIFPRSMERFSICDTMLSSILVFHADLYIFFVCHIFQILNNTCRSMCKCHRFRILPFFPEGRRQKSMLDNTCVHVFSRSGWKTGATTWLINMAILDETRVQNDPFFDLSQLWTYTKEKNLQKPWKPVCSLFAWT